MLLSTVSFAVMSAIVKLLKHYPLPQIMFFRSLLALLAVILYLLLSRRISRLKTSRPWTHVSRGLLGVSAMACCFYSIRSIDLATAVALIHTKALFVIPFAALILREAFYRKRLGIASIGFLGILILLNPSAPELNIGSASAIIGAMLIALAMMCVRSLGKTDTTESIVFYFMLTATLVTAIASLFEWDPISTSKDLLILCTIGFTGVLGQLFMVLAYKAAEASFVAPLDYMQLVWSALIGIVFWSEMPTIWLVSGSLIIVASQIALQRHAYTLKAIDSKTPAS
jgi:drug/metabolite transporter (DMT)-like permease